MDETSVPEEISAFDEMRLTKAEVYVLDNSPGVDSLISYILDKGKVALTELSHDLFYFDPDGLNWHLEHLYQLGAVDIDFRDDRTITANRETVKYKGRRYGMLSVVADFIERETTQMESGPDGRLKRSRSAAECLHRNFDALLAVRRSEDVMPYEEFLKVYRHMGHGERLRMLHYGLLDFHRDASGEAMVYLTEKAAAAIDALESV